MINLQVHRSQSALAVCLLVLTSSVALAQRADDVPAPSNSGGLLAGPKVEEQATASDDNAMGRPNAQRGQTIPMQRWLAALRGLNLSESQLTRVRSVAAEFEKAQQEFQREHADELNALREARQKASEGGEIDPALRQSLQSIEANRPKPQPYQERIWELLTADQQEEMKQKIAQMQAQAPRRQGGGDGAERRRGEGADPGMSPDMMSKPDTMTPGSAGSESMNGSSASQPRPSIERDRGIPGAVGLDEAGKRRAQFLRSRQSSDRPGGAPTATEKQFDFEDDAPAGEGRESGS